MSIRIKYSEIPKQIIAMIVIPIVFIFGFIEAMFYVEPFIHNETVFQVLLILGSFIVIGFAAFTVLKVILPEATVSYDDSGIHFLLKRNSLFFKREFFVEYANIENTAVDEDPQGRTFASIRTRSPKKTMLLYPFEKKATTEFTDYWQKLFAEVSKHPSVAVKITHTSFFQGSTMKFIGWVVIACTIFLTVWKILHPDAVSTWELIAMYVMVLPFVIIFLKSNKPFVKNEK